MTAAPTPTTYEPPRQGRRGQFLDAVVILVLIFATLFVTTYLTSEDSTDAGPTQVQSVNDLPVSPGERVQYQRMIDSGTADLPTVAADVAANQPRSDKYEIDALALVGTAVLLALYLGFVYRASFREYREVIEEKFGPGTEDDR
jgi:hypothetical protein